MAINAGSVVATLELDSGKFTSALQRAGTDLANLGNAGDSLGTRVASLGNAMTTTGSALTKGFTLPLAAIGTASAKVAMDFEAGMSKVQAISGASAEDMKILSEKAKQMGATTKFSATEASDALSYMAMAGWKTNDMMDGLEGIMNLAAASGEDLAMVSDIVTDALTAFGMSAKDSAGFADLLASASSNSNTNVALLGESFKYVAPVAGALGISAKDTALALGLMANAGIKGSQSGTALRASLTNLANPTKKMKKEMDELGISLIDSNGNVKEGKVLFDELREKFGKLTPAQQASSAATIFGKEAMSGMLAIINASEADYNKLVTSLDNSAGSAKNMADINNNNLKGSLTLLKSALEGAGIAIGETLLPMIKDAVEVINDWVDKFNNLDAKTKENTVKIGLFAAAIGPALLVTGNMIKTIGGAIDGFGKLFGTIGKINFGAIIGGIKDFASGLANAVVKSAEFIANLVKMGVELAINAAKAFADAVVQGAKFTAEIIKQGVQFAIQTAKMVASTVATVAHNVAAVACTVATTALTVATTALGAAFTFLTSPIGLVVLAIGAVIAIGVLLYKNWDTVKEYAAIFGEYIKEKFNAIKDAIAGAWDWVKEKTAQAWDWVKSHLEIVMPIIGTIIGGPIGLVVGLIIGNWDKIKSATITAFNAVKTFLSNVWNGIKSTASSTWKSIKSTIDSVIKGIKNVITSVWSGIKSFTSSVWNGIKTISSSVWKGIKNTVTSIVNGIKSVVSSVFKAIKNTVSSIWNGIKSGASSSWKGIRTTISNIIKSIRSVISSVFKSVKSTVSSIWNGIKSVTSSVWNGIKNGVSSAIKGVKSTVSSVVNSVRSTVSSVWNSIRSTTSSVWNKIKSAITTPINSAKNTVSSAINSIKAFFRGIKLPAITIPHIKLPHFSLVGKFSLAPPSVPKLNVSWYKEGGILTKPTIFGMMGNQYLGGGEAGMEAVLPIEKLSGILAETLDKMPSRHGGTSTVQNNITMNITTNNSDRIVRELRYALGGGL